MSEKKVKNTLLNMALTLTIITGASAVLLGFVYGKTKVEIDKAASNKELTALKEVLKTGFDNSPNKDTVLINDDNNVPLTLYIAKEKGEKSSIAVKSYTKRAFSGEMWVIVGFDMDGSIIKIKVIDQKETPGLGTKVTEDGFKSQFFGKNPSKENIDVKKDGGVIDAITAATISSRAYSDAVKRAHKVFVKYINQTNKED